MIGSGGSCVQFYDPVYCYTNSSNCTLYINQTAYFVCKCSHENCITKWISNNKSSTVKTVTDTTYSVIVTDDIAGIMTCVDKSNDNMYTWTVTVLKPSKCTLNCLACVNYDSSFTTGVFLKL